MRNAARRNATADYTLSVDIGGDATQADMVRGPDFADGLSGGLDYWDVANLSGGDRLNVRAGTGNVVVGALANGDTVRNLGCEMVDSTRWYQTRRGTEQ